MRCLACNRKLNDRERTRKYASSGTYVDLCNRCFSFVAEDIPDIDDGTGVDYSEFEDEETTATGGYVDEQFEWGTDVEGDRDGHNNENYSE